MPTLPECQHIRGADCTHGCPTEPCGAVDHRQAHPDCPVHRIGPDDVMHGQAHWPGTTACHPPAPPADDDGCGECGVPSGPCRPDCPSNDPMTGLKLTELADIARRVHKALTNGPWTPNTFQAIEAVFASHGVTFDEPEG